jgi:uncharacterized membrane protein YeaQ/YmgE (transglycosylase-associated protein family)
MFSIMVWCFFGLIVGFISKCLHPGDDPVGLIPTIFIGVCGSVIGGFFNWILAYGQAPYEPSGFLMSILGGVIFCVIWRFYNLKNSTDGPRNFFNGKKMNG